MAQERDFLDELDGNEATEADEPVEVEPELPETADETDDESETEAPAAPEAHEGKDVPYAAMKAERDKRQESQRELKESRQKYAELERQIQELRNPVQPQQQPQQVTNIWEDPDAYIAQRIGNVQQQSDARLHAALAAQAREVYPDYDDMLGEVLEYAKVNPAIENDLMSKPNPAVAAYKLGKQLIEHRKMQDPDTYRASIEAEVRAKMEAEYKAKDAARSKAANAIPPDLTSARNVNTNSTSAQPDPFDLAFKRN